MIIKSIMEIDILTFNETVECFSLLLKGSRVSFHIVFCLKTLLDFLFISQKGSRVGVPGKRYVMV